VGQFAPEAAKQHCFGHVVRSARRSSRLFDPNGTVPRIQDRLFAHPAWPVSISPKPVRLPALCLSAIPDGKRYPLFLELL